MAASATGALSEVTSLRVSPYPDHMNIDLVAVPEELPENLDDLADDVLITPVVWAHLQGGVKHTSVLSVKARSDARRGTPDERPGDMPAASPTRLGQTPTWTMGAFRAWDAARPGKGKGGGRPAGGRADSRDRIMSPFPFPCPHCGEPVTQEQAEVAYAAAQAGAAEAAAGRPAAKRPARSKAPASGPGGRKRPRTASADR